MNDKPIQVGDLVMVMRPGCNNNNLGRIFKVLAIRALSRECRSCGTFHGDPAGTLAAVHDLNTGGAFALQRLKRLDPDSLKDDVPTKEEIHA